MEPYEQDIKDLIIARLKTRPSDISVSIGGSSDSTTSDLIKHVQAGDEIGKKLMEVEMRFLRSLKTGSIYELLNETETSADAAHS